MLADIRDVLSRLHGVKGGHGQWTAQCPAHADRQNSLSVGEGEDKRVLLHCHAGCDLEKITAALGLSTKDLFPDKPQQQDTATYYDYRDDAGKLLAQKIRKPGKKFSWRQPDGRHGWIYNRKGVPFLLYAPNGLSTSAFLCEGEKDVDTLCTFGYSAACGMDGAGPGKWKPEYTNQLRGHNVCVFTDNDDVGRAYAAETCNSLHGVASSVKMLDIATVWADIPEHGDVSDMVAVLGAERTKELFRELLANTPEWIPTVEPIESKQLQVISAQDLQRANLPPVKFIVDDILPEGTSLVSAASKIGKSWMMLDLGLSVATGEPFMGHKTNQCGVLYLALEDSLNRLQDRMNKILKEKPAPKQFYFVTVAPKLDEGLLDMLDEHMKQHPDTKLIVVDTLQKVRGQARPRESAYAQDYREMEQVKAHMDKQGLSLMFVHHNRKMRDTDDPFNMISGTTGIMGAVDTIWTLIKNSRTDNSATLHITGRDVPQGDTVIQFNMTTWTWESIGDAGWVERQQAKAEYDENPIVKTIKKLLEQSTEHRWDGAAKDLMSAGRFIAHTYLASSTKKLGKDITALEKQLLIYDRIVHDTSDNGTGGKRHSFWYQDMTQFEELPNGSQEKMPWLDT